MRSLSSVSRIALAAAPLGLLLSDGCLATFQRNLDLLLGAGALENVRLLPYSPVAPLAELLLRFWSG